MTAQHLPSAPHRLDIDGLRALAVIPVIFFHVGFTKFVGGFVGVDVFFVISGYLITRIINRELQQGRFSLAEFYRRRVLRIFPALFAMFAVTTIIASFFLLPLELVRYCESLISAAGFGSNIYFNFQPSGYFNGESATKGLLHTWSLSVEEQFYLFWPVILAVAHAKSFNRVRQISIFIIAISFAYSVWLVSTGSTSGFFLIPSRAWELMIGALIAVIPAARNENRWLREILSVSGILAILYCVRRYTSGTDFPGLAALAPCLGAAAIIYAGGSGTSLGAKFLSLRPIVFIGKISFSLYLWHWPVIFFVEVGLMRQQTLPIQLGEIFASLVLGYVSWRYVEQPFRTGVPGTSTKKVLSSAVVLMAITSVVGVAGILSNGLPDRFSKNQQAMAKFESIDGNRLFRSGSCFIISLHEKFDEKNCLSRDVNKPTVLLIGDSHAAHLWPGLQQNHNFNVLQATHWGCRPVVSNAALGIPKCQDFVRQIITQWLPKNPVDIVILAGRWQEKDLPDLASTISLAKPYSSYVSVVGPIQQYNASLPRLLAWSPENDHTLTRSYLSEQPFSIEPRIKEIALDSGAHYFSLIDYFCKNNACAELAKSNVPLQIDYGHLSAEGSSLVAGSLLRSVSLSGPEKKYLQSAQ